MPSTKWKNLTERIQKDRPTFRYLPFGTLRDTASDFVRQASDGETAAVFLMHGTPVRQDDLLDVYTKRPFGRVFEALKRVRNLLDPVFKEVD